ncbi:MAG: histidinol-phosphate transaminase [Proteobacteria bacterium]|nr:histidinol-phosphate transaminase [Pseudomonadota bacterium]
MAKSLLPLDCVRTIAPYQPGKPIGELARELSLDPAAIIKLASNENPLGCSKSVIGAFMNELEEVARYPDGSGFALKQQLSAKLGIPSDYLILGNGSNDVLEIASIAFLDRDRSAVYSEFCFVVNKLATQSRAAQGIEVPATNYSHDLARMFDAIQKNTRVIFISNPNNPTGTFLSPRDILSFIEQVSEHILIILDEAYYEYLPLELQSESVNWVKRFPNLLVTRTFSKIYGLASLRVGYGIANPSVAEILNRVRQPFNVNSYGLAAARTSLLDDEFVRDSVRMNDLGMHQFVSFAEKLELAFIPSRGNFLTFEFDQEGIEVYQRLLKRGVIVRPLLGYGLPNHLRVSIGLTEENERFCEELEAVLNEKR